MWSFEAIGLPALIEGLTTLENGLADPEAALALLALEAGADIRENFEQGGRPDRWPDITAASRAQRKSNKTSGPLIDTEALMDAASASSAGVAGSLFGIEGDMLTLGSDLVYAATQQFGRGGIPARAYEDIQPEDAIRLAATYESDYLHKILAGTTLL